jgi:hypothetical protein
VAAADQQEEDSDFGDRAKHSVKKVEAVRQALAHDPDMKPVQGVKYIKTHFNIDITTSNFSAYKSQIRARQQKGLEGNGGRGGYSAEPTASDLLTVKKAIEEEGESIESFGKMVEQIEKVGQRVGGIDSLKHCLNALRALAGIG